MKRHLHLALIFLKNCFLVETEFRFAFSVWIIHDIIWLLLNLILVELIFGQITAIASWTKYQVLVLVSVRTMFNSLMWLFVWPNLARFHELVRKGDLDFVLTKPVNPRFLVSTRLFEFDQLLRIGVAVGFIAYFLQRLGISPSLFDLFNFLFFLLAGMAIFYNFCFMITTTNFWFANIFNLENLFDTLQSIGQYPSTIFRGGIRLALVYLIPSIFVSFFPTLALLGKANINMFLLAITFLLVSAWLSQKFWNFALRHYSSASS